MSHGIPNRAASIMYALTMGTFGVLHLKYADEWKVAVPSFMPGESWFWMYVTGGAFILAALAIVIHKFAKLACYLLALMLMIIAVVLYLKSAADGDMGALTMLIKDTGLAMAAIIIGNISK